MKKDVLKTFTAGVLCGALVFGSATVFATNYVAELASFKVFFNGNEFKPQQPTLAVNGSTYLPLKAIGDALGVAVKWNGDLNQVEIGSTPSTAAPVVSASYSRSNPAPINTVQSVSVDDYSTKYNANMRVTEIIRGDNAWKLIKTANQFNDAPAEGYEYILAKVAISVMSVDGDKSVDLSKHNFTCFSGTNEESPSGSVVMPTPAFEGKLYAGGSSEGYISVQVKKDDQNPKIVYALNYDGSGGTWFATK